MKNKLFILIIALIPILTFSQGLNYQDLKTLIDSSSSVSNNYAKNNGFQYYSSDYSNGNIVRYTKKDNSSDAYYFLSLAWDSTMKFISYQTPSKSNANNLINTIKKLGYKYSENYVNDGGLCQDFDSSNYHIELCEDRIENSNIVTYIFTMSKK